MAFLPEMRGILIATSTVKPFEDERSPKCTDNKLMSVKTKKILIPQEISLSTHGCTNTIQIEYCLMIGFYLYERSQSCLGQPVPPVGAYLDQLSLTREDLRSRKIEVWRFHTSHSRSFAKPLVNHQLSRWTINFSDCRNGICVYVDDLVFEEDRQLWMWGAGRESQRQRWIKSRPGWKSEPDLVTRLRWAKDAKLRLRCFFLKRSVTLLLGLKFH